jgi:hypothetical protein
LPGGVKLSIAHRIPEVFEQGANGYDDPQEYLLATLNACRIVGFAALCGLKRIALQKNRDHH